MNKVINNLFLVTLVFSCTPKIAEPIVEETIEISSPIKEAPAHPCVQFNDLPSSEKDMAETAFVLYRDQVKANNYEKALPYWRKAFNLAPGSNGSVKYHFEDGANIYKQLFNTTEDEGLKARYVDTIMMIYDKRKECFGDEAYINGLKAFDYYYYFDQYTSQENIYDLFKSNFDVKGKNADYFVINPFTKVIFDRTLQGDLPYDEGRKYAKLILKAVDHGMATCKDKACESWEIINDYSPVMLESLEGVDDFYDCGYYADKYYALFEQYPDSCEIINLAYARMLRGKCTTNDTRLAKVKEAKDTKCYVAPPALSCAAQGNDDYGQGRYNQAIASYLSCVDQFSDTESKAKYLLLVAKIYYRDVKNYPKSRQYALEAAALKSNWGEPYMLIGNLYASSGPLCGTGRGWESQVVTWPAIDMWTKAKSIDASVASEANQMINRYRQYMPKKEDIFFRKLAAGSSYFIPCWIQQSTTIRTAD